MLATASLPLEQTYKSVLSGYLRDGDESHLNEAYEIGREALWAGYGLVGLINLHCTALVSCVQEGDHGNTVINTAAASGRLLMQATAPFTILQINQTESNAALRRLNGMFEESTNRIAHALHDDATQLLSVAYLELSQLRSEVPDTMQERIDRLTGYLDQTCEQLRHLSHELRPPMLEHLGLLPSLRNLVGSIQRRNGLDITLHAPDIERGLLRDVELPLYRAVQEGLTNIVRHAHANHAWVTLEISPDQVACSIRDDGMGISSETASNSNPDAGLGLLILRERIAILQGTVDIQSNPGSGTNLRVRIPLTV